MREFESLPQAILAARDRLLPHIRVTACEPNSCLSQHHSADVWLKSEHLQHTGSFKARGALHKLLCLSPSERRTGVVTASSGNHGAGVAWASQALGVQAIVFVPEGASSAKVDIIKGYGANVQTFGTDGVESEIHARQYAADHGSVYVSPYNDIDVVAGQGTVGIELVEQMGSVDAVIVAVGGGGLIGGTAAYLKSLMPNVRVIGAQPEKSPVMALSVRAGRVVEFASEPTLSDGSAGGIEPGAITLDLCRTLVDDWVLTSEEEIAAAMRAFITERDQVIEGSAAVALATLAHIDARGQRVAVVLCGGNVSQETLRKVMQ